MLSASLVGNGALGEADQLCQGLFAGQVGGGADGGIKGAVTQSL